MLFKQRTMLAAAAASLFSLPYWTSSSGVQESVDDALASPEAEVHASAQLPELPEAASLAAATASTVQPRVGDLQSSAPVGLWEALQFNVTSDWILRRWPRVSTLTSQTKMKGYRVPLVTGTSTGDVAGSLTYYFDTDHKLQRIILHGSTGDYQQIVAIVTHQHKLKREDTAIPGLQLYRTYWDGQAKSELRIQPTKVVSANNPHRRYDVHLLIERPAESKWFSKGRQPPVSRMQL